ncbi:MAG: ATP-dependent zinc metalloprotease FtsH [Clostridiales bacterium]|nr:ATP-dependent zinc metalloprotease FtsH [Clostridiales bacterium]
MRARYEKVFRLCVLALMLGMILFVVLQNQSQAVEEIDYQTFLQRVKAGQVSQVQLGEGAKLTAKDKAGNRFRFDNPRIETLKHSLLLQGITVTEQVIGPGSLALLAFLLTVGGLAVWGKVRQGVRAPVGKSVMESEKTVPTTRFEQVAANEEAMESLRDLVSFIRSPEKYSRYGARIPRGVLLYGPPGTGKTLMARALAGEAGVPFFAVNGADFVEMYVGVGASRVRTLFAKARKAGSAVIFIDEIDAIGKKRDNTSDEREQTLNALLSEMSGFREQEGIIVMAATNRIDTLDEALLRAGRFDRQIEVPLPGYEERVKILQVHAQGKPIDEGVSLPALAAQTALFSGARLESMLNEAAIIAAKRNAQSITREDIDHAYDVMLCGMDRRSGFGLERERELTAAHEAGHALTTFFLLPDSHIRKVSIVPSSKGAAGYSMAIQPEKMFHSKQELLHHIAVALAGRAAEEILYGSDMVSTGAANDLEKAAALSRRMVCEWGMLPDGDGLYLFNQAKRDEAAQQWLQLGYELAKKVLLGYRAAWNRLTLLLLARDAVSEEEVKACLAQEARYS